MDYHRCSGVGSETTTGWVYNEPAVAAGTDLIHCTVTSDGVESAWAVVSTESHTLPLPIRLQLPGEQKRGLFPTLYFLHFVAQLLDQASSHIHSLSGQANLS